MVCNSYNSDFCVYSRAALPNFQNQSFYFYFSLMIKNAYPPRNQFNSFTVIQALLDQCRDQLLSPRPAPKEDPKTLSASSERWMALRKSPNECTMIICNFLCKWCANISHWISKCNIYSSLPERVDNRIDSKLPNTTFFFKIRAIFFILVECHEHC